MIPLITQPTTPEPVNQMLLAALKSCWDLGIDKNLVPMVRAAIAAAEQAPQPTELTDEDIEAIRQRVFSTNNPYCPVDSKSMRKAARAVLAAQKGKAK